MSKKVLWAIKQQTDNPKALDLYLYDNIKSDGEDWWTGETIESNTSASHVQKVLDEATDVEQINIFINSYGGDVKEGLAIYNQLLRCKANKNVYIDGFACSIASVIAMAGDKIIMGSNTLMMLHHASMGAYGTSAELRKAADDLDVIDNASCSSYKAKAGDKISDEELKTILDNETWLTAEQCLSYGLCDEIAGSEDKNITEAKQRLNNIIKQEIEGLEPKPPVPPQFANQKSNYEKMRQAFIKNIK